MRVLFAWEMGRNYGHVTQIVAVARELAARGMEITIAPQRPEIWSEFAEGIECRLIQAPYSPVPPPKPGEQPNIPMGYPEDLLPCGYDDPAKIAAMVSCWRSLYELAKPDVIVAQAAPTALLSARGTDIKTAVLGNGYDVPPPTCPMPPLRYWENTDEKILAARESRILANINAAMKLLKLPELEKFSDAIKADETFLCSLAELDHYPARGGAEYYGPFIKTDSGAEMKWNEGAVKRIFAYIRPGSPAFAAMTGALLQLPDDHDAIVAAPGISTDLLGKAGKPNLRIVNGPVRLDLLMENCDLAVHHASAGIGHAFALAGAPALMLPTHIEQLMFARAIGRAGLGRGLVGNIGKNDILRTAAQLLTEPQYRDKARAFAAKYSRFDYASLPGRIADKIAALKTDRKK